MNERKLDIRKLAPIDVYITSNITVWRQLGMWQDRKKRYTFVPTRPIGYIFITKHDEAIYCKPLKGYTLIRPAGLELVWDTDKLVTFHTLSMTDAMEWRIHARTTLLKIIDGTCHNNDIPF